MNLIGAIFDLDGTILDSMVNWDTLAERYLISLGIKPRENINEVFKDMSMKQAAVHYQKYYGIKKSIDEIINGINGIVRDFYHNDVELKDGVYDYLSMLYDKNVKMCIATASDKHLSEAALTRCGVRQYFTAIFTCSEIGRGKDVPFIYQAALQELGTNKNETIVFEDALYAIKTAKNAGFIVAGVYDKYEANQKKVREISDYYIEDFKKAEVLLP